MTNSYSYYPLTYPQKNIFQTEITYPGTSIGTIAATLRISDEDINLEYIQQALNLVIQTNDAMRCRIKIVDRQPMQYFKKHENIIFDEYDFTNKPQSALFEYDEEQTKKPFEIIDSPLYYFSLIKLSNSECAIYSKVHHLINDAWAIVRVGNLVLDYYENLSRGIDIDVSNVPQYVDYITDEQDYLSNARLNVDKNFWASKLENHPNNAILKQRKLKYSNLKSNRKTFLLPEKLSKQLREYSKETKTSLFAVMLSAFAIYLKRVTHQGNMVIGTPVLNRSSRRQKKTLGMFISTVPLFINLEEDDNFLAFNKKLTREWMSVLKHQRYPYEYILKEAREKHKDLKDLFDIVISYQNASFTENDSSAHHKSRWHINSCQLESLSVHINDREGEGILVIDYDYLEEMFFEKEIDFLHDNFIRVLWHALDNPTRKMSKLELISEAEKKKMLIDFNSEIVEYPKDQTIIDLLDFQSKKTPDNIALIYEEKRITYAQLNDMSNSLANLLIDSGIMPEDIVSIMMDKSIEMIVAIIATLKAGGAYLAIEKDFPLERKKFIQKDSQSRFLITENICNESNEFSGKSIFVDSHDFSQNKHNPDYKNLKSDSLAYIIYTSGTTGYPKGVMIEHKSVVNYIYAFLNEFKYNGDEIVLEQSSYSFDAFVEEVYPTLCSGGTLVIADKYGAKDMKKLAETINKHKISVVSVSPLVLNELNKINNFKSIKTYISGGDVLKYEYCSNLIKHADVYNTYGPTEATVCATYHKCDVKLKDNILIGKPIANYSVYILDSNLSLVPIGAPGELYISGPGLARGYLNRPELSSQLFTDNPFMTGEKMYRTKDVARWYPMGEIGYIGRSDRQVKIRGIRIELGEIESELLKHENIKSVVVVDKLVDNEKKKLCLYYEKSGEVSVKEIRSYLKNRLPAYMVPSYFLEMDRLPLSESGKVNLKALPEISRMILNEENEYIAPETNIEIRLVGLIEKVLKLEHVGVGDNYFELGGDSLDLTGLSYDISDEFKVDIPLEKLFRAETIREIAQTISIAAPRGEENSSDNNVFLLHEGEKDKNIFFIHDGIGGIGAYLDLCNELVDYNIWGIRANITTNIEPQNILIEDMAKSYAKQIVNIVDGPYTVAGWCIGGTIAYEVVRQLQKMGKHTHTLFLIDTIGPKRWYNEDRFTLNGENLFVATNLNYKSQKNSFEKFNSIKELWEKVAEDIEYSTEKDIIIKDFIQKIPDDIIHYLDDYHDSPIRDIFSFVNLVRTFHIARAFYFPIGKIETDICFIQASEDSVVSDFDIWKKCTNGNVTHSIVEGNHYTMLNSIGANEIANTMLAKISLSEAEYAKL